MDSETKGKPATELKAEDVIACTECGYIFWVPGLRIEEDIFGEKWASCPKCEAMLIERNS